MCTRPWANGEVLGTGIEIGSTVVMTIDVIKAKALSCPTVETDHSFELLVSGNDLSRPAARLRGAPSTS